MTKQEIFPLYVGRCKFGIKGFPQQFDFVGIREHRVFAGFQEPTDYSFYDISDCQLVLKRISGMSDEDCRDFAIELAGVTSNLWDNDEIARKQAIADIRNLSNQKIGDFFSAVNATLWLIKHGYALNDEWFDNGIAVEEK